MTNLPTKERMTGIEANIAKLTTAEDVSNISGPVTTLAKEQVATKDGTVRYFRICLWGYGGEAAYLKLTKDQYDYWRAKDDEEHDSTMNYMAGEDGDCDLEAIPTQMKFLCQVDCDGKVYETNWYEAPTEFCHQWGIEVGGGKMTIEEIESDDYSAKVLETVVDAEDLQSYLHSIDSENDYTLQLVNMSTAKGTDEQPDYILQFYSAEKGTFFDGTFKSSEPFDPKKLKVFTEEFPNGEDIVQAMTYDDENIVNNGGMTVGKGSSVHMWSNV